MSLPSWTGAAIALLILVAYTAYREPAFFKLTNLLNILEQNAAVGIVAIGMTLAITLGGIDLSVGALVALAGGLGIWVMNTVLGAQQLIAAANPAADAAVITAPSGVAVWLAKLWTSLGIAGSDPGAFAVAAVVTIGIGTVAGFVNGSLIAKGRIAPFIVTLAALSGFRSIAMWIADGGQYFSRGSSWLTEFGEGFAIPGTNISRNPRRVVPADFPYAILAWTLVAIWASVVLNRTRLGRYIIAIGNNERAARYSAIAVDRVKILTYTLLGTVTGIAALITAANYNSVNSANTGTLWELDAIAAVVIGGTRMEGGSGSIFGTVIGVLLLGVIRNMMVMLQINPYAHGLVTGVIIVAAVLVQRTGSRT